MNTQPNTPASRTEQAAPSVASGVEVDQREAFLDHWVKDVPVEYRAAARERADKDLLLDLGRGPLRIAADAWQAGYALAAPGAAVAAREQTESNWLWRHKRSGGLYQLVGTAKLQSDTPLADMSEVEVYRGEDGALWARAAQEFKERFVRALPSASRPEPPAVDAGEKEAASRFTTKYPLLNDLLQETWWLGKGPNNMDTGLAWFESLERFLEWLASRPEAPPASASPATVAQLVTDEQIIEVWNSWPRQGITSRRTAVEFARAVLAAAAAAQPCASQGCALSHAQVEAAYTAWCHSKHMDPFVRMSTALRATLSGLEHVGKESAR